MMVDPDTPFSSRWYATPAARRATRRVGVKLRRLVLARAAKLPDATILRVLTLMVLVIASSWIVYPRTFPSVSPPTIDAMSRNDLATHAIPTTIPVNAVISTGRIGISAGGDSGPLAASQAQAAAQAGPALDPTTTAPIEVLPGSLLPEHRILLMYGLPGDPSFGSLGSYDNLRLLEFMRAKAAEYQELDPSRPIILGVEIIASLAQRTPGADGSYLRDTSATTIYSYIEFTRANDMVLFLDVQIGRRTVPDDVQRLERYLQEPHVHLAIDPEFDVERTEIPTIDPGTVTAADIRWTQDYLAALAKDHDVPPKILMVHQFTPDMVVNKPLLRPVAGVQLVIDSTLWGTPEEKRSAFQQFVTDDRVEFGGIMVNGTWDTPAMGTGDVINLPGAPDIVIYQ